MCVCVGGDEGGWGGLHAFMHMCVYVCVYLYFVFTCLLTGGGGGGVYGILHSPCVLQKPWHTPNFHVKLKAGVKKRGFNCRYTGTCSCFDKGFL